MRNETIFSKPSGTLEDLVAAAWGRAGPNKDPAAAIRWLRERTGWDLEEVLVIVTAGKQLNGANEMIIVRKTYGGPGLTSFGDLPQEVRAGANNLQVGETFTWMGDGRERELTLLDRAEMTWEEYERWREQSLKALEEQERWLRAIAAS